MSVRDPARGLLVAGLVALVAASPAAPRADRVDTLAVYGGLGSWLDVYAGDAWERPDAVVATLERHGVRTLYLQTSNYSQAADVVRPAALGALVEVAHAAGIRVVGWYLPSFADPRRDARRTLAALRFRTAHGQAFDSFALDIEAGVVRDVRLRNRRLLALSRLARETAPPGYPLGAIIPSPVGMRRHPHYWPSFPYAALARVYDALLPMAYFSHYERTVAGASHYAREAVATVRARTGRPDAVVHLIGGIASQAPPAAFAAFDRAAAACGVQGLSLYALLQTSPREWADLERTALGGPARGCG